MSLAILFHFLCTQTQPHQICNTQRTEVCTISN